jgi:hypothetical protein
LGKSLARNEPIQLPLRWQFVPVESPADRAIRWRWRAYTQSGALALESEGDFETLTQCMDAAKGAGYGPA